VIHGTFYKKKASHLRSLDSPGVRMRSPGSPEITQRNISPVIHGTVYKKLVTEVIRYSCVRNEVTRITWDHTTECITGDKWYFL